MSDASPTLISQLTPPGKGAIAVLAVRGPAAWSAARALFSRFTRRQKGLAELTPLPEHPSSGRFYLGKLGAALGQADEAVLLVRAVAPQPWIELHCHGGTELIRCIIDAFRNHGIEERPWLEFESGDKSDVLEVLSQAPTVRTAAIALDQWHGAFDNKLAEVEELLAVSRRDEAWAVVQRWIELIPVGRHLVEPWHVVIAGPPNVGKSSLVNALVGQTRCLVAPEPGTTRDVVKTTIALDGWPIELLDTAGLRGTADLLEEEGIRRAWNVSSEADLRIWLLDGSAAPNMPPPGLTEWLFVINKVDLPAAWDWASLPGASSVSAATGAGMAVLAQAVVDRLVPRPPAPGEAVPCTPQMQAIVAQLAERLGRKLSW